MKSPQFLGVSVPRWPVGVKNGRMKQLFAFLALITLGLGVAVAQTVAVKAFIPYGDAKAILDVLREDLVPAELTAKTPAELQRLWPSWVAGRDAAIRARVGRGDEDSIIHLLLFGTTFTKRPRATQEELAGLATGPAAALASLRPRIADFAAAVASPGTNERLLFARRVIEGQGIDVATDAGRSALLRYLEERTVTVGGAVRSSALFNAGAELSDKLTLFRDRGLSSDTSIFIGLGIEQALERIKDEGPLRTGTVQRVAIIGPGLDFTDKLEGYDFYPQQTIQPFALIDSLLRFGLAVEGDLSVTAFDLSPRVIQHLEAARDRARAGDGYGIVVPRNLDRPWTPALVQYWERFGNHVGQNTSAAAPPDAGRVEVRRVRVRPSVVLSIVPRDLNAVVERLEPLPPDEQFDLVVVTNVLLYYGVFEQSLAAANIAAMLRPGGVLLTNNRIFELPAIPLGGVGYSDSVYMSLAGIGETGDRIIWYGRQ